MNIQKALNENNFYYNNTILNKKEKKIEIIQKEDYGNKYNNNMNSDNSNDKGNNSCNGLMELTHNYDKVNYDYLDKLPYTIEQQNNDITITRNDIIINKDKDKDEEEEENEEKKSTLFQPQINKSRYNENMIVFVKENELNYLYPTISKDLTNNQNENKNENESKRKNEIENESKRENKNENESKRENENENSPQIKLFSKLEINSRRKPFAISNFNKEEQVNQ